jgi:hypothetical protein
MTNSPIISQELFVKVIQSIQLQLAEDKKNSELVAEAFGATDFSLYDNHKLINSIIDLLEVYFDPKFFREEITFFCFQLNFGKLANDEDFESIEQLYCRLAKNKNY